MLSFVKAERLNNILGKGHFYEPVHAEQCTRDRIPRT